MKFGCGVSIFVFLFICLQLQLQHSEAVKCPFNKHNETKECSACAGVFCGFDGDGTAGCSSDDLSKNCPKKYDNDIDFIKRRSIKFYKNGHFVYFSGCSGAADGVKCLKDEGRKINEEIDKKKANDKYKEPFYIENNANNQNCALKLIGFIAIGWILVAWIY